MKKILTVLGTRPEAIKMAPIIVELNRNPESFECVVCSTGQHREMLDQVFGLFDIQPQIDLELMVPGQTLGEITSRAIAGLDQVMGKENPDVVLVQGDTTTAMCGALAAHYHRCLVGHVEAGLRTGNKFAPFPEEMNRRLIGRLADLHFAPTLQAVRALENEGISEACIHLTGNTVIDALQWVRDRVLESRPRLPEKLDDQLGHAPMVLVTGHRRESFGPGFESICQAILDVVAAEPEVHFVYPVHLNPNVREPVNRYLANQPRIHLIEPLTYEPFVWLMSRATVVLTDSGGVQEEAPSLGKPVLVMRETTERPEGVEAGNARLVGVDRNAIADNVKLLLNNPQEREAMTSVSNPYGDGTAALQICKVLQGL